jgi:outer membrane lipoprotein-sorting protein
MKRILLRSVLGLALVAACTVSTSRLYAQEAVKAEDILDREAEAVGGKAAHEKVKTFLMTGTISVRDEKQKFNIQFAPDKFYKELAVEGIETQEIVVNGKTAWKNNSITGPELLKGADRANAYREAANMTGVFKRVGNWRTQFKEVKYAGEAQVNGKPASKVHLTAQDGSECIDYFDKETGLQVRRDILGDGQKTVMVQHFSDFRKVDGITHAFTTRLEAGDVQVVVTIEHIEQNVNIPDERFAVPSEVRRLLEAQK